MQVKTAVLWWLINNRVHQSLENEEKTIKSLIPLVEELFPGIMFLNESSFQSLMLEYTVPVLQKRYPELLTTPMEDIGPTDMTEVTSFLPSNGFEWQSTMEWGLLFQMLLAEI